MPSRRAGGSRRWMVCTAGAVALGAALGAWLNAVPGWAQAGGGGTEPAAVQPGQPGVPPRPNRDPSSIMDRAADSGAQVFVDDSFASVDQIRKALLYARQGQAQLAIRTFQEIIDKYGQKLVYLNDNSYVSITDYVHEQLLQMPAVKDGLYDQMYGGDAQRAVDAAVQQRDAATLIRVCDRYFPSTAAFHGLSQAADWYFERGEFSAAARLWQQLLVHPLAAKNQTTLLFHAGAAEALARNGAAARRLRAQLATLAPDATGMVDGAPVRLLAKLDQILAMAPWEAVDLSGNEWPAFDGGPSRSGLLAVNASIGARLWSVPLVADDDKSGPQPTVNPALRQQRMIINGRLVTQEVDTGLASFPVLSNGDLFIHAGDRILCLSANAGTLLWTYPSAPEVVSRNDPNLEMQVRYGGITARPSAHDSVAVYGNQVFAVLPAPAGGGAFNPRPVLYNAVTYGNTRVVCLDRDDAHEIWSRSAQDVKLDSAGTLSFVGSPLVTRQGVFVMARKSGDATFSHLYLIRLDRETGDVTWSCYLCSNSNTGVLIGNPYMSAVPIPVPTLVDDVLYVSSELGADCAVDANAGRILWLRITDAPRNTQPYAIAAQYATASWKFNPPLVYGDKLVTDDNGQGLRVYDRWTGKVLAKVTPSNLDGMHVDVMAGISGSHLIVSGTADQGQQTYEVQSFNLDTIEQKTTPEWVDPINVGSADGLGQPQGRPFLTATTYYVPGAHRLARVDLRRGKLLDMLPWPNTERDVDGTPSTAKPGNLLVTSEQVVVVNDKEVAGYSKWETALDNHLAKIKAAPNDAAPYLALAEISFRTNHWDLAQENMKKAVDLGNRPAGNGAGGNGPEDMLRRLYRTNLNFAEQMLNKNDDTLRDQARFYFEQCRAAARDPEQQAEWRLRLSELALKQKNLAEAANLYQEVLSDPALRGAPYRLGDSLSRAGVAAASRFEALKKSAPEVYRRFEDQAAALLAKARAQKDLRGLQQVIDSYPNSASAVTAGMEIATAYRDAKDWSNATRALKYVLDHAPRNQQAQTLADMATAYMQWGPKYYRPAASYAARGQRGFKDFAWNDAAGRKMTFAGLAQQLQERTGVDVDGRVPALHAASDPPVMNTPQELASGGANLLVPVESSPAFRPPNLLFVQTGNRVRVYDTDRGADLPGTPVQLPQNQAAVLLGCAHDTAVFLQTNMVVGVNLKSPGKIWTRRIEGGPAPLIRPPIQANIRQLGGQIIINGPNGPVIVQGNNIQIAGGEIFADGVAVQNGAAAGLDAESMRAAAFAQLQRPNFSTARILDDRVLIVAGGKLEAYDLTTGEPAWRDRSQNPVSAKLPDGVPTALLGNTDVLVVEINSADQGSPTFYVVDADTGQFRKQIKLRTDEHAQWRALGDDGTLYVVSDQAVAAYDAASDRSDPVWWRNGLTTRYASATALTPYSLMFVDSNLDLMCLSLDGGEQIFPDTTGGNGADLRLNLTASQGQVPLLRSWVDGDQVVYQSNEAMAAYPVQPGADGRLHMQWDATYPYGTSPPPSLQGMQLSDQYIVEYGAGPMQAVQRAVCFILRTRSSGRLRKVQPLKADTPMAPPDSMEGPVIRNWQLVDNGIAFAGNGRVWFMQPAHK